MYKALLYVYNNYDDFSKPIEFLLSLIENEEEKNDKPVKKILNFILILIEI